MNKRRKQGRGRVISIEKESKVNLNYTSFSNQLDSFDKFKDIINPPYEPSILFALSEQSNSLKQLYNSYSANIAGFGWGIKYKEDFDYNKAEEDIKKQADYEWRKLELIYKYINPKEPFNDVVEKALYDKELLGYGCIEVLRNSLKEVAQIEYCQSANIRICNNKDNTVELLQWQEDINGNRIQVPVIMKFKKFVQRVNDKKVYFKEFGDPRNLNYITGEYREDTLNHELATELAFFNVHDGYSKYGSPRWIGSSTNVSGSILSEKLNYEYFKSGRITPSAITVSGGQLTNESILALKNSKGIENAYKTIVLEAEAFPPDENDTIMGSKVGTSNQVKIDIKSLIDTNNNDALFQNYQKDNKEKVRDTFKLPPIYTGSSSDYTRSTADVAKNIAEEQIFRPERKKIANIFNTIINNELGIKYCEMYFIDPDISNTKDLTEALEPFIKAGTVTPNMLMDVLGEMINKTYEPLPDEIGNLPFDIVKLKYQHMLTQNNMQEQELETIKILNNMSEDIQKALGE